MKEKIDLLGAIVAHVIFVSSIITFSSRMIFKLQPGHWIGIPILLMAFPLGHLLIMAPEFNRPFLYYVQVVTMLVWLTALFLAEKKSPSVIIPRMQPGRPLFPTAT